MASSIPASFDFGLVTRRGDVGGLPSGIVVIGKA